MSGSDDAISDTPSGELGLLLQKVAAAPAVDPGPLRGGRLGRYFVIEELGRGGMGVVLRAYDPKLLREVALKVLRAPRFTERHEARLVREARAMAQLSHPNVVAVYDVESSSDRLVLSMEYVRGTTLTEWLAQEARDWASVVDAFVDAGRGLAAAHAVGLLHRDFKPSNVLVGEDGRIRVTDFGLATVRDAAVSNDSHPAIASSEASGPLWEPLTDAGSHPGTPLYMAPEQHEGGELTPAIDQYALCVALWQALSGELPFSIDDLEANKLAGPAPWPRGARVPGVVVDALRRGLAPRPSDRWPSIETLLKALRRGRARMRRRRISFGFVAVGLIGAFAIGARYLYRAHRIEACEREGERVAEVWNDDARAGLRQGLVGSGAAHASTTADKTLPWLDARAAGWQKAATEACLDREVRQIWDSNTYDRAVWCLGERRVELEALVGKLSDPDTRAVTHAVSAAARLRRAETCRDAASLALLPTPPREQREEVQALRAELSRAGALQATGAYDAALAVARETLARVDVVAWPPLTASARLYVGSGLDRTGDYEGAEKMLELAYFEAAEAGATAEAFEAALRLVYTIGSRLARPEDARRWAHHAKVMLRRLPNDGGLRDALLKHYLGIVHSKAGDYAQAKQAYEEALAIQQATLGADHPDVAMRLNNLANVHKLMGAEDQAQEFYERALAAKHKALGADHPHVAGSLNNLAMVSFDRGDHERALELFEQALEIYEAVHGANHPVVGHTLNNVGLVFSETADVERAEAAFERALSILETTLGPEHPDLARILTNLARVQLTRHDYERAIAMNERALALTEQALGAEHPQVASVLGNVAAVHMERRNYDAARALYEKSLAINDKTRPDSPETADTLANLATLLVKQGDHTRAEPLYKRALAILEKARGADHPALARSLRGLAKVALAKGRSEQALNHAERALNLQKAAPPLQLAHSRFLVAQALTAAHRDLARATKLATLARDAYGRAGDADGERKASSWLTKNSPP